MNYFFLLTFSIISLSISAQHQRCGHEWLLNQNPEMTAKTRETQELIQRNLGQINMRNTIIIPVVVHVVWSNDAENISDQMIYSQIEALNKAFNQAPNLDMIPAEFQPFAATTGIQFGFAALDEMGQPTTGILRTRTTQGNTGINGTYYDPNMGGSRGWDNNKYLNIWVANTGANIAGFAFNPSSFGQNGHGVVIHPKYFGLNQHAKYGQGKTTVHEVGHYLGLNHLWADDSDCNTDDGIADTPPQENANSGCPTYPHSTGCSTSEMFMNYMDYTYDQCMWMFTNDQKNWMLTTISTFYPEFLNSSIPIRNPNQIAEQDFILYPNPTQLDIKILFANDQNKLISYRIFDALGQLIKEENVFVQKDLLFETKDLTAGSYYIKVDDVIKRFVKL
jgi:Pregnancy-associated plasma protein-A/Secretion system C-terminal sorting domain